VTNHDKFHLCLHRLSSAVIHSPKGDLGGNKMKVKRVVTNVAGKRVSAAKRFYQGILGLDLLMDLGWIATYGSDTKMGIQISFASQGGSGTEVPDISIEVDDVDEAYRRMKKAKFKIEYNLTNEPWGVRRFYVRDPFGKLVNILSHLRVQGRQIR
jgi:catechol 2,3-dioxygenase-like lactoylglutathione lyase family enzyme